MISIQEWFLIGMKRDIPEIVSSRRDGAVVDLGGHGENIRKVHCCLTLPDWNAKCPIPFEAGSVETIWASHFFEHLPGEDVVAVLKECERVLRPGGQLNICVPYYTSQLAAECLDHRTRWNEETFHNLFRMYYPTTLVGAPYTWRLKVAAQFILAIVERNTALFIQLLREEGV